MPQVSFILDLLHDLGMQEVIRMEETQEGAPGNSLEMLAPTSPAVSYVQHLETL
jgi:hypothetical protein